MIPKFITAALRGERPSVFGDGEQTRDFCYIDNAVAREPPGRRDHPQARRARSSTSPAASERRSTGCCRYIGELVGTKSIREYGPPRAGDVRDSLADIRAAQELLGYEPRVDVRQGLQRTIDAFRRFTT